MKPASPCWMRIPANPAAFAPCPPTRHTRASRWTAIPSISPTARRFTAPRRCCPTCWTISRMMRNWRFCRITRRFSRIRHTQRRRRRFWTTKRFTCSTAPPCPPLEQKQAEDILADARAALHQIPPNVYSAVEIATYHARLNHTHLLESSFWVSGDQHVSTLRQRLLDGECTVETFVQELTRIVQMMTLENGVCS